MSAQDPSGSVDTLSQLTSASPHKRYGRWWRRHPSNIWLYFIPVTALFLFGLILPLLDTVRRSIALGAGGWVELLQNSLFRQAVVNTVRYNTIVTILSVALAYTIATAIWRSGPKGRIVLLSCVIIPFVTSVLVRVVAWNALLRNNGVINTILIELGLVDEPLRLFPGTVATIVGMIQWVLPYAVFPILGVMLRLDRNLEQAAESLGSNPWQTFRHVVFPLTMPGVLASTLLVFVLSIGFYVIPETLGSPSDLMIANVIALYGLELIDFQVASAAAVALLVVVGLLTLVYQRVDRTTQ